MAATPIRNESNAVLIASLLAPDDSPITTVFMRFLLVDRDAFTLVDGTDRRFEGGDGVEHLSTGNRERRAAFDGVGEGFQLCAQRILWIERQAALCFAAFSQDELGFAEDFGGAEG